MIRPGTRVYVSDWYQHGTVIRAAKNGIGEQGYAVRLDDGTIAVVYGIGDVPLVRSVVPAPAYVPQPRDMEAS